MDELYAVSDLHLGGRPGFQIFNQGQVLAGLIDHLRERPAERRVALVLNGDIVDFLSEEGSAYLKADTAVASLERVLRDPAFAPVWQALSRFVRAPRRHLVLVMGNHDVELALPAVRERLLQELCGDDEAARGRVHDAMGGAGFRCQVGRAQVLCTHGNEVDSWNLVDHEALRKVALCQNRGQAPPSWDPNAGTQLVIDVMNQIKARHPFVDLLKPETKVVPGILLALDPSVLAKLARLAPVAYRLARGGAQNAGFLSAGGAPAEAQERSAEQAAIDLFIGPARRGAINTQAEARELLRQAERDFAAGLLPMQLAAQTGATETLGFGRYLWDRITGQPPEEALRLALLDWLKDDRTFALDTPDETYEQLDQAAGPEIDFLLAGHTHLARALARKGGHGTYFNSGTWIRLIHLRTELLRDAAAFAPVYKALTAGTMEALDRTPGLILLRPTVVRVFDGPDGTVGELALAVPDKDKDKDRGRVTLQSVPGTRAVRS
jgi:UDP-2,3-diacylglucosamine pyrophosphatase LpxH